MNFVHALAHFFYPRHSNNHRAKLIHSSSLFFLALILVVYQILLQSVPVSGLKILGYAANISPSQVISFTNQKREEAGLSPLQYDSSLEAAAKAKGEHMLEHNYWAHVSPEGTEPWIFFTNAGYTYRYAGENLARDFSNPESAIEAWMASPSHKENLLSAKYNDIGVAVVEGDLNGVDTTIIVQLFGTELSETVSQIPYAEAKSEEVATVSSLTGSAVPTLSPLAQITPFPEENVITLAEPAEEEKNGFGVMISPFNTTRNVSLVTVLTLFVVMGVDGVVISRKKLSRSGGRTFAHLAFLGMILALVLIARVGEIL